MKNHVKLREDRRKLAVAKLAVRYKLAIHNKSENTKRLKYFFVALASITTASTSAFVFYTLLIG